VIGVSAGGPTAVTMGARHPRLVRRLLLLGAVGFGPYPDRRTRLGAHVVFNPVAEPVT
jgi:pimeloyl-ACP methyl ester carboxylesterase